MYSRTSGCPFITTAKRVLSDYAIAYNEVYIDRDNEARARVLEWTGFLSVPTLVIAEPGEQLPYEPVEPLERGTSPRGIDRGAMLTEPSRAELERWLLRHGFISEIAAD